MRVAIVCDWLTSRGGAEKVTEQLAKIFPRADIYASVVNIEYFPWLKDRRVTTSWLQKIPVLRDKHQLFPHVRPLIFENFDLSNYDLVISSCSAESKSIITKPRTVHVCYCHTPIRYYWSDYHEYFGKRLEFGWLNPIIKVVMPWFTNKLRMFDRLSAERVDFFVANSKNTQKRIAKYYRRQSEVITPPVEFLDDYNGNKVKDGDYYLCLGRLIPYKKADLVVEAFLKSKRKLIVAGDGPLKKKLLKMIPDHSSVEILGYVSDNEKWKLLAECRALVFPAEEDLGIVPLEAMSFGKPVIAYGLGGVLETVIDGKTGVFFDSQNPELLNKAVEKFEGMKFDKKKIREHARGFGEERFKKEIMGFIGEVVGNEQ
ncbi:glycosyltransferase [Patescibacteria group bacterium]|nr:glycosyltransferase [Patescibacteria group bacterium]